jgi:glycosyltransferase involved in cell wall biosynthesis
LYVWRAIRLSKAIFTVSEFSKGRIQYHFHTKKDIQVVYSGITNKLKDYKPNNIIKKNYFIYVGNVKQHKGIDLLLNAYKKARDKGLKSKLYIVGEYNNFRSSADLSGLIDDKENIKFTGRVSDEALYRLISEAKALVLPSRYEGFGLPPLESLYLGTNAIITDIPAMKEIYKNLPVTFFKSNNVEDLINSLFSEQEPIDVIKVRKIIDGKYNFTLIASRILNYIARIYN